MYLGAALQLWMTTACDAKPEAQCDHASRLSRNRRSARTAKRGLTYQLNAESPEQAERWFAALRDKDPRFEVYRRSASYFERQPGDHDFDPRLMLQMNGTFYAYGPNIKTG